MSDRLSLYGVAPVAWQAASGMRFRMLEGMLGELASWKVKTVIVGPMPHQDRMIEVFTNLLGREPVSQGGVYVWWQVQA
jgi:hypothetical protein